MARRQTQRRVGGNPPVITASQQVIASAQRAQRLSCDEWIELSKAGMKVIQSDGRPYWQRFGYTSEQEAVDEAARTARESSICKPDVIYKPIAGRRRKTRRTRRGRKTRGRR